MGVSVHALVRTVSPQKNNFTSHRYDGRMSTLSTIVSDIRPDVVFHLAALASYDHSPSDIDAMVDANIRLGVQLAEACSQRGKIVFINVGTYWQNGQGTSRYEPVSLYAAMKQAFQDIAVYYARATPLRIATLKFFDVYGPNDPRGKLLAQLDEARTTKTSLPLSPGKQLIEMVHIDDAVAALIHAARLHRER
jgi:nucleoside-diphosphate-sugar epimerase